MAQRKDSTKGVAPAPVAAIGRGASDTLVEGSRRFSQPHTQPQSRANPVGRGWGRWWVGVGLAGLLVVGGRVMHDSWSAWRAGQAAEGRGEGVRAARLYLQAVRMYLPGSPTVGWALERLEGIAGEALRVGDLGRERGALEAVRSGLLGARSLYTPHPERLERANQRLAEIYARLEDPEVAPGADLGTRAAWHRQRLAVQPGPAVPATLAALGGLALWLGAVVAFIRRGVDRALRLDRRRAVSSGTLFVVGLTVFLLGLRFA